MINKPIELLAPAGNLQSFNVALACGADAIYLGVNSFNARGNIENISLDNLREVTDKAHLFGVKIYLTLNTLVLDDEIEEVLKVVRKAIEAKVDAFIVQDIGLAYLLRKTFENIELHASTQMGIENLEGATFLKGLNFKRIVLARETPLSEIKRIKNCLDIDIEYFVQGALCVGFSGNCYLCSLLASASGNRGKCKQFCRLPYTAATGKKEKKGYLLSTKDFCMLPKLEQLISSGVTSLKIEGRARRAAYVGQAVSTYRKVLDNNFLFSQNDVDDLKKVFNRGDYISGYFAGEKIIYDKTQNHIGLPIGRVLDVKIGKRFNEVKIKSNHDLIKGDSLKFFVDGKEQASVSVQDIRQNGKDIYTFTTTTRVEKNALVSLTVSKAQEDEIMAKTRKLDVDAHLLCQCNKKAKLKLICGEIEVLAESEEVLQEAVSQPLSQVECQNQISKLGQNFSLTKFEAVIEKVFMRKAELNELRRKAVALLQNAIVQNYIDKNKLNDICEKKEEISTQNLLKSGKKAKNGKIIYMSEDLKKLQEKSGEENAILVFVPSDFQKQEEDILSFCEINSCKTLYLSLPVIATEEDIKLYQILLAKKSNLGVLANNYYALSLVNKDKTIVGSEMNVFNSFAIAFYKERGFKKIILSKEAIDISKLSDCGCEIFVNTLVKNNLIYFKHCPIKEHFGSSCSACSYCDDVTYSLVGQGKFLLRRTRSKSCQFALKDTNYTKKQSGDFGEVIEI